MASASEVLKRLEILRRRQDDEGWHVNANTCSLAIEFIEASMPNAITDEELKDRLRDVAIKVFPSANQWAVAEGVKNIIAIMDEIGPVEYAALCATLHRIGSPAAARAAIAKAITP
jgi:N-acyl-L-homoserine lactone synthetase